MDPWAASNTTIIDSDYLGPSAPSSLHPQLRSRKSNLATNAQVVDRHPLRSPSPSHTSFAATPSNQTRPEADSRKPSAVASEWKAISAGLAGLLEDRHLTQVRLATSGLQIRLLTLKLHHTR